MRPGISTGVIAITRGLAFAIYISLTNRRSLEGKGNAMFATGRKSWRQALYIFSGGMVVWFSIVGGLALHG